MLLFLFSSDSIHNLCVVLKNSHDGAVLFWGPLSLQVELKKHERGHVVNLVLQIILNRMFGFRAHYLDCIFMHVAFDNPSIFSSS